MTTVPDGPRRAAFLDRDGVLNALVERDAAMASPRRLADFHVLPGTREAVERLHALGYLVLVVSNQPDVARGLLEPTVLAAMTERLRAEVALDEVRYCTHDDADGCACRKPKPGMLTDLATRWRVDLRASVVIGDSWKDLEAGRAAGCHTIYVGAESGAGVPAGRTASSLADAVAQVAVGL